MAEASWNLINPFSLLLASLGYCYFLLTRIPLGILRFMFLLPIFYLFSILPWYFPSALLRGILSFFITWIASSKLLLFCFNQGPLVHCQNFPDFIAISILPMKIKEQPTSSRSVSILLLLLKYYVCKAMHAPGAISIYVTLSF